MLSADLEGTDAELRAKVISPSSTGLTKGQSLTETMKRGASFKIGTIWQIQARECLVLPWRHSVAYYLTISM